MKKMFILLLAVLAITSCNTSNEDVNYLIVGYFPSYNPRANADSCRWNMTHVNLSFATVNADGTLNEEDVRRSYPDVARHCRENNVKIMVSLGGGGPKEEQDAFANAVLDDVARENLIRNTMALVNELGLDGVDIDYEAWHYQQSYIDSIVPALEKLFVGFRKAMGNSKELSSAVAIYGLDANGYTKATMESMNYMTIMAYDLTGWSSVMGPHSPFSYVQEGCEKALQHGARPDQIVVGVPFYGRGWHNLELDKMYGGNYNRIVRDNPGAENRNELYGDNGEPEFWYDGFPALDEKFAYIKENGFRGFMFWELTGDSRDDSKSLLLHMNKLTGADR